MRKKQVVISVYDGIAKVEKCPEAIEVVILDYDYLKGLPYSQWGELNREAMLKHDPDFAHGREALEVTRR
jgi:hypothetical protein